MRRTLRRSVTLAMAAALLLATGPLVGIASSSDVGCGSVITSDTKLTHDITGCKSTGLYIGADNITLDLGGFVLSGLNTSQSKGIDTQGRSAVVLTNGTVKGFNRGLWVSGPGTPPLNYPTTVGTGGLNNTIRDMVVKYNGTNIMLWGAANAVVSNNKVFGGRSNGLDMIGGDGDHSILNNKIHSNGGLGIHNDFEGGHLIEGNIITYNGREGIRTIPSLTIRNNNVSHNMSAGIFQYPHGQGASSAMTITGNTVCDNGRDGIAMTAEGHTITDNNVGAGTTGCLPNARISGYDLFDAEAAQEDPEDLLFECRSTWRNNYTQGDTFNHPCVTR